MKPSIIRVGDTVLVRPGALRVIKVGYEQDFITYLEQIEKAERAESKCSLDQLLTTSRIRKFISDYTDTPPNSINPHAITHVAKGLASQLTTNLCGQERKIFFGNPIPPEPVREVIEKRCVRTGKHYSAWSGASYDGEYAYEPGGLENPKTHVVLRLAPVSWDDFELTRSDGTIKPFNSGLWVLQTDVTKIPPTDNGETQ